MAGRKPEDEGFGTESALTLSEIKYARTYVRRTGAEEGKGGVEWRRCAITDSRQVDSAI